MISRKTISLPDRLNTTASLRPSRTDEPGVAVRGVAPCAGVQQRLPSLLDDPIAFGHRGARAHAQENTLEAFELALRLGANGLESDVWLTADGVPVLDHDGVLRRRVGRSRPIGTIARGDLPAHIPTLADLITHCGSDYHLSFDLKDAGSGEATIDGRGAARPGDARPPVAVRPDHRTLLDLRGRGARLVDSTRLGKIKEGPERRAASPRRRGHRRDQHAPHRLDRRARRPVPSLRPGGLRVGHAARTRPQRPRCGWASTAIYSDWVDRMVEAYTAELRPGPAWP